MSTKMKSWIFAILAFLTFGVGNVVAVQPAQAQTAPAAGGGGFMDWMSSMFTEPEKTTMAQSVQEFTQRYNQVCWPCMIFNQFANQVFTKGQQVSSNAAPAMRRIIGAVSVVFCLFYLGGGLVAGDASDIARRWTTVWKFLLGAALGSIFVGNAFTNMWDWVYGPIMAVPIAINNEFGQVSVNTLSLAAANISCPVGAVPGGPSGAQGIVNGMQGIVCGGHRLSGAGMAYGWALINHVDGFFGTITNVISGIILMAVFCWVAITFPLRFIDILIRLTIIGILSPVIIVLAVFKPTRSYVTTAAENVLYVGCLFAFTGIMFNMGAEVFSGVLNSSLQGMQNDTDTVGIIVNGIILVGGGIVFSAMIQMAPTLAKEFSGFKGGSGGVGDAVGGAISSVTSVASKGAGAVGGMPVSMAKGAVRNHYASKAIGGKVAEALGKS